MTTIKNGRPKLRSTRSQKLNRRGSIDTSQKVLIDAFGFPPFSFEDDVVVVNEELGRFILGKKIKIELRPVPNKQEIAIRMVIEGLIAASKSYRTWRASWPTIGLDSWTSPCTWFVVSARSQQDNGAVIATWSQENRTLGISLPHTTMWIGHGLAWLATYDRCCAKNEQNPTPWMGKSCGCEDS